MITIIISYIHRRRRQRLSLPLLLYYSLICLFISLIVVSLVNGDSTTHDSLSLPKTDPNAEYSIKQQSASSQSNHENTEDKNKEQANKTAATASGSHSSQKSHQHAPHKHHNNRTFGPEPNDELLVNTQNGYVRGRSYLLDYHLPRGSRPRSFPFGRRKYRVNAWLGIPYAEKPINERRFKHPDPVKNWDGVLDATEWPNSCYQINDTVIPDFWGVNMWNPNTKVSEDCLYVNVWTPHPRPRNSPVLVWIYGGGFATGTSTLRIYDPRIIVAETNLIYVSLQYRVSLFGFFYMGHPDAPGNQGLMDQNLALRWIHNNIQYFGGDNSKITIFGESAGSVSVSLHLLSPLSSNLFRSAIMQSGSSLADWVMLSKEKAIERYTDVIGSFGCRNENVTEAMACARRIDATTAIEAAEGHFYSQTNSAVAQYPFLPVVDNLFLEEEPIILLNRGKFKKCPVLLGANKDEGNWFFVYFFPEYRNLTAPPVISYDTFREFMADLFTFYPQFPASSSSVIQEAIMYRYTNWNNAHNQKSNIENIDDAAGDYHFLCPVVDWANAYAIKNQDVYMYHYTHRSSNHLWPDWMGVMHGDEISFVFGEAIDPLNNYTYNEKVLARKMLKYWSNFVRFQNPNGPVDEKTGESSSVPGYNYINEFKATHGYTTQTFSQYIESWPKYRILNNHYDDYQRAYIILNSDKIDIGYNLRAEYCTFWGSFLPKLILGKPQCECTGPCLDNIHNKTLSSSANKLTGQHQALNSILSLLLYQVLTTK